MKVTSEMKIKDVLSIGDGMLEALMWLAPEFERLRYPKLRRAMSGRVTVAQAARIGRVPLTEALYLLNLAAGENETLLVGELEMMKPEAFEYKKTNPPRKPVELLGVPDTDVRVLFVDVMEQADRKQDPMPAIARGLVALKKPEDILLVRHPFDPIPLRDMLARRGFASWAEERRDGDWYIYFYRPAAAAAAAVAHPSIINRAYAHIAAAGM